MPRSSRHSTIRRVHRALDLPGDPLAGTSVDYAFNIFAAGFLREADLTDEDLLVRLLDPRRALDAGYEARRSRGLEPATFRRRLTALVRKEGGALRVPAPPQPCLAANLDVVCAALQLDELDRQILLFALACRSWALQSLLDPIVCQTPRALATVVATAVAQPVVAVQKALRRESRLVSSGLLNVLRQGDVDDRLDLDARLIEALARDSLDPAGLMDRFVPVAPAPGVRLADFPHLAGEIDLATRLLAGALRQHGKGVNILIHGPTGTGKSELARLIAASLEAPIYVAGAADDNGNAPTASERLTSLRMGHRLIARARALLLFDELEDLFEMSSYNRVVGVGHDKSHMSKQWFNLFLETNPVPTVWISNDVAGVDPAFLRRFSFILEVGSFTAGQRRRAWTRHLGEQHRLAAGDVDALAARYQLSPAHIGGAVAAARLACQGEVDRPTLEALLRPAEKVLAGQQAPLAPFDPRAYRPELVNTPVDLEALAARLTGWRPGDGPGVSLCLYGPPGTGKSAYVRYLAHRMDRPLLVRRGSDLLSCWLGETEQNLAAAFEEARREGAVLLFDEVDSFLQDRRTAVRSWEVTQTNEFLEQLEVFPGLCACTTNLFRNLDQAVLRRFIFKVPFDYLRAEQAESLFRAALAELGTGAAGDAAGLRGLVNLTPGDFSAVTRRLRALRERVSAEGLVAELRAEARVKEVAATRIGF
jgi:transitional endoplasmic reticulum ATPase